MDKIIFINEKNGKEYNSYDDFGFLIKEFIVDEATVKEEKIDIPGSSESLDFSDSLSGDYNYNERNINITLNKIRGNIFLEDYSKLQNALHGKRMKIIHSNDAGFYWIGSVNVGMFNPHKIVSEISLICKVDPYKYEICSSDEDWPWDPFSFIDGIINETKDLVVNGELEVTIIGRRKHIIPLISCSNDMQVEFNDVVYDLDEGSQEILNIEIVEGENKLKFIGNGTVTVSYRGGSL